MKRLLIVDDDPAVRRSLTIALESEGLRITAAGTAAEGLAVFAAQSPDAVILDLFLPDRHGLEVLREIRSRDPDASVIVVTASEDVRDGVEAMKRGALEYLVKPYDVEALKLLLRRLLETRRDRQELGQHRRKLTERYTFDAIECRTPAFADVVAQAKKLAASASATILLEGETGVGKEFFARAIHHASPRAEGPFTAISCAAIPETLLESELFGHEAGAFTDARTRKRGLFELAEGGTLMLDEIGEMAPAMQAKLLRVIETRTFRRVGGTDDLTVDARVIAATNVVLQQAVAARSFREDLYYRLKVGHLTIPPLRDRPDDLGATADRMLGEICRELGHKPCVLSVAAKAVILGYRWPGNVRELRNVLERALLLREGDGPIEPAQLSSLEQRPSKADAGSLAELERDHILRVLDASGGNQTRAAKTLGISRNTLWEKLKQYRPGGPR